MATQGLAAPEKRHIKDAYRFPGFVPLATVEELPGRLRDKTAWAVTLRRRGKKDGLRELRHGVPGLVRQQGTALQGLRLRDGRDLPADRCQEGRLPRV